MSNVERLREALLGVERLRGLVKAADLAAMSATARAHGLLNMAEDRLNAALSQAPESGGTWAESTDYLGSTEASKAEKYELISQEFAKATGNEYVDLTPKLDRLPAPVVNLMYEIYKRPTGR